MTVNDSKVCGGLPAVGFPSPTSEGGRPVTSPAAGNGNDSNLNNPGSNGNYWSSSPNSDNSNNAWNLNFNSSNFNRNNNNRYNGQSVRPVRVLAAATADDASHRLLEDLYCAYLAARRHKRGKWYQVGFEMRQEHELVKLRDELLERRYAARPSNCFIIHDPKMREVFAAEFRDRVVHHLFYNYTHKLFERTFIADCYSCIEGRGMHYGVERLKKHIRSCSQNWSKPCYVLKLDIKGYFMSINRARLLVRCREILLKQRRKYTEDADGFAIKDTKSAKERDWELVDYLLESICMLNPLENCRVIGDMSEWMLLPKEKSLFHSKPGCGLPIGNLSSQLFSNVYLGAFDDFMKRDVKCRHYGRYVDDAYVVASTKEELYDIVPKARSFLREALELELNEKKVLAVDAYKGVEFLGAYVKPYRTYPARRSLKRMRGRMKALDWSEHPNRIQARVNSMLGVLSHYDCWHMRKLLVWETRLRQFGKVTDDCLRFYPDRLQLRLQRNRGIR